ncbi:MAG: RHS repeat-associated core domain-containing protein, partial [Armatimonadota bacterium]
GTGGTAVTTLYVYDGFNCIAEYAGAALSKTRTWGLDLSGSLQGAGGVGGLLEEKQGATSYYPTYDGNGNISEYLTSAGAVAAHYEYDPFGNDISPAPPTGVTYVNFAYRFSTKPLDSETGLYYYGYRYYDPLTGRWPSRDPIGEMGGKNLYGFVGNNGISAYDALGEAPGTIYSNRYEAFRDASRTVIAATDASAVTGLAEVAEAQKHIQYNAQGGYFKSNDNSLFTSEKKSIEFKGKTFSKIIYDYVVGVEFGTFIYCIGRGANAGKYSYTEPTRGTPPTIFQYVGNLWQGNVFVDDDVLDKIRNNGDTPKAWVHSHNVQRYVGEPGDVHLVDQSGQYKLTKPEDSDVAESLGFVVCSVTADGFDCTSRE